MLRVLAALVLSGCVLVASASASQWIVDWQAPFDERLQKLGAEPENVLQTLLAAPPSEASSAAHIAQYHYTLSQTYYSLSYPHKALQQAQLAVAAIDSETQPWLFHQTRLAEAAALDISGTPKQGLVGVNAALVWGELQQDSDLVVSALFTRGALLTSLLDYQSALEDLQRAYDLVGPTHVTLNKGLIASMLALVYEYRAEHDLAIPFFEQAAEFHRQSKNWLDVSIALYGLGRANKHIGKLDLSKAQLLESQQLAREVGDMQGAAYALQELGGIEVEENNLRKANAYFTEALSIFEQSENRHMQLETALSLAQLAIAQKRNKAAADYLQIAYRAVDPQSMPLQKVAIDETHARYLALTGDFEQAYQLLQNTVPEKEKAFSQTRTETLHSIRAKYELEIKERENQQLEQENTEKRASLQSSQTKNLQLMLLFGSSLVICALLMLLVYRTRQNKARLETLANIDSLTGISNRRHTLEQLQNQIDLAERHDVALAVAIADLDHFKRINDTHGHAIGDRVLRAVGRLSQDTFRHTDIIGRIGGEEFLIGLPYTSLSDAEKTLKSWSLKIKELAPNLDVDGLQLSLSCGVTVLKPGEDMAELMLQADKALYSAKQKGRDRVELYRTE